MSKIELAKIKSLTFYKGEVTTARRTSPLKQTICVGKPCKLYQPEVIRCVSLGGTGIDVDWKCEADLPDSLRFGKVEVSCEGWSKPGDPYVLKGSCALEYRLVEVPGALLREPDTSLFNPSSYDWSTILFSVLWVAVLLFIVYSFLESCFRSNTTPRAASRTSGHNPRPGGGGSTGGWFPGNYHNDDSSPPPPYSKTQQQPGAQPGWQPGFFTGAAVGGLASHLWNRSRNEPARPTNYDWEQRFQPRARPWFFGGGGEGGGFGRQRASQSDDRGEGSSNLGSMRRSTGLGGSNVR